MERSSGAVVYKTEKGTRLYLLLHYEAGHWDFPKGNVEEGEGERETALREIKEETGIKKVVFEEGFRNVIHYFYKREGKTIYKEVVFSLAKTDEKKVTLSFEHIGFEWLPYEKAVGRLTFQTAKEVLRFAEEFLEIRGCRKCLLWKTRKNAVPGEGNRKARVFFVGQAPGRSEDETGRPFVGRAGKFLNELLKLAGIRRSEVFITSALKCFPPANRKPKKDEVKACHPSWKNRLTQSSPSLSFFLGKWLARARE